MSVLGVSLLPGERRRAERFAALLDGSRIVEDRELAPLLSLATRLQPAPLAPRPDFRAALRATLVAEASARVPALPAQRTARVEPPKHRVRQLVATGVAMAVVAGAGAAAASTHALPGDSLYGVKRGLESVELSLARSDMSRGRELLEQADSRLSEAESLAAAAEARSAHSRGLIATALADMGTATRAGVAALNASYAETGDRQALVLLDRFLGEQRGRLADLEGLLGPTLRAQVAGLADLLARLQTHVDAILTAATSTAGAAGTAVAAPDGSRDAGNGWAVTKVFDQLGQVASSAGATTYGSQTGNSAVADGSEYLGSDLDSSVGGTLGDLTGATATSPPSSRLSGGAAGVTSAPALPSAPSGTPVPAPVPAPLPAPVPTVVVPRVSAPAVLPPPAAPPPITPPPVATPPVSLPAVTCVPPLTSC